MKDGFLCLCAVSLLAVLFTGCASKTSFPLAVITKQVVTEPELVTMGPVQGKATRVSLLFGLFQFGCSKSAEGITYGRVEIEKKTLPVFGSALLLFQGHGELKKESDASTTCNVNDRVHRAVAAAGYDACQKSGADVLVDPKFQVEDYNFLWIYRRTTCLVEGTAAKVERINSVEYVNPLALN